MVAGYALMFLYTVAMLGRPNAVEQRAYLAMAGISAVGMGMLVSLGMTMTLGFFYTTIHGVLPFLAMGESRLLGNLDRKFNIFSASGLFKVVALMTDLNHRHVIVSALI